MGELIRWEAASNPQPFSGERLTSAVSGYQVEIEHYHRYLLARDFCRGRDVLDVASGEGYGTALLAQVARSAIGIENDAAIVTAARSEFRRSNLRYEQGDARALPIRDASVDVVVSFETLEHILEHELFISELRRVMRAGGLLVISTPDRDVYSPVGTPSNPYHVLELTKAEFENLLRRHFINTAFAAQRAVIGSVAISAVQEVAPRAFERRGVTHVEANDHFPRAPYLIGLASDGELPPLPNSIYIHRSDLDTEMELRIRTEAQLRALQVEKVAVEARAAEALHALQAEKVAVEARAAEALQRADASTNELAIAEQQAEVATARLVQTERRIVELQRQAGVQAAERTIRETTYQATLAALSDQFAQNIGQIAALREQLARSEESVQTILYSTSWRLTQLPRRLGSRHPRLALCGRRGLKAIYWLLTLQIHQRYRLWRNAKRAKQEAATRPPSMHEETVHPEPGHSIRSLISADSKIDQFTGSMCDAQQLGNTLSESSFSSADINATPAHWFYLGDIITWLQAHEHLTGVGRVTAELFFASLGHKSTPSVPCILAGEVNELMAVSPLGTVSYLTARTHALNGSGSAAPVPIPLSTSPSVLHRGDHVLFTGLVWTNIYKSLFQKLSDRGIRFSVLIHDIIPIEYPHIVDSNHREMFAGWLETVATLASIIFVSSVIIKDQILRWAALSNVCLNARIVPVRFGCAAVERDTSDENLRTKVGIASAGLGSFVLSVGTIDTRKNQALLCRLWTRLVSDLGASNTPRLVLVGRDDLNVGHLGEGIASLIATKKIVVLQGLTDVELAALYRSCLFTVFPSMIEGYGLPVAESLRYGKLCVSSDLPVIREHAADLPWYFNPEDEADAYKLLLRAISDHEARANVEARIAECFKPYSWGTTYRAICEAISQRLEERGTSNPARKDVEGPVVPGLPAALVPTALVNSQKWCVDCKPDVSIIIINWNAATLTLECVKQIWANTDSIRYEIIIVDNGSRPEEVQPLKSLGRGVRLLELKVNRFFGEANNIAAELAAGRYLCFLNNDAFGRPGWLRSLVDVLEHTPNAGAVGPTLLFPNNTIQEAGAIINELGYPERLGRGHGIDSAEFLTPRVVDYISAAALVLTRDLFLAVGGFDLVYEPAYYEDADLCFKIRAIRKNICYCPDAQVVHIEGAAANDDPVAISRRSALGDLNRDKFTARWNAYLKSRAGPDIERIGRILKLKGGSRTIAPSPIKVREGKRTAALFTPYMLTPGGGERYLLTLASALQEDHAVTIVTPHRYSALRLLQLGREFSVDASSLDIVTEENFRSGSRPDLLVTLGNHIIPPIRAWARDSMYVCQFPFPLSLDEIRANQQLLTGYRCIISYSEYTREHILAQLSAYQLPSVPTKVVYPPVQLEPGGAAQKKNIILSVGRFFTGGHDKRHDAIIRAFAGLLELINSDVELHLAGSSMPDHMDYLNQLREMAKGLPVVFHVNALPDELSELYRDAAVYWHSTGLEADLANHPEKAEHFGITIVEAMAAECVVLGFNSGGPRELITHGIDGFLYSSIEEMQALTLRIIDGPENTRKSVGTAARARASAFSQDKFVRRIRELIQRLTEKPDLLVET